MVTLVEESGDKDEPHRGRPLTLLRYESPSERTARLAPDVELGDTLIKRGPAVMAVMGAATRDPERFPDPDRLDLARATTATSPSLGAHFCFGAPLARIEGQIAFRAAAPAARPRRAPARSRGAQIWGCAGSRRCRSRSSHVPPNVEGLSADKRALLEQRLRGRARPCRRSPDR